ncbi:MAG: hypothetical protein ACRD0D_08060 [Acidimicrobiales bacterium]
MSILADPLDDYVRDVVLEALDGPWLAKVLRQRAGADKDTRKLSEALGRLQGRLGAALTGGLSQPVQRQGHLVEPQLRWPPWSRLLRD